MKYSKQISAFILLLLCFAGVRADWKKVKVNSFAWFHSVYFVNQNKGWIVGSQGTFLETNDGGLTWKTKEKFTQDTIRDVYFSDESNGWILCQRDIYNVGTFSPSYILRTSNGGISWDKVTLEGEGKERLVKMFFTKDGFGRAVGENGTFFAMQDDKTTWKKISLATRFLLLDTNFSNRNNGVVVGGGGTILITDDGGNTWNPAGFVNKSNTKLNSVYFVNSNTGWAVGAEGKIFFTNNGGKVWRNQISNITSDLLDVFFLSSGEGWAVGEEGAILYTTTAGNIWSPIQNSIKHKIERIFFIGKKGWAVGFGGTILTYQKGSSLVEPSKQKPELLKRTTTAP